MNAASKLTLAEMRAIADRIFGHLEWGEEEHGFCHCPGEALHENCNGKHDCRISLDKVPTIYCVHTSCAGVIEEANRELRSALSRGACNGEPHRPTADELAARAKRHAELDAANQLRADAQASRDEILGRWDWSEYDAWNASPLRLDGECEDDWRLHLAIFPPEGVIWIGNERDSGSQKHSANFRRVSEWVARDTPSGSFTCGSMFLDGCFSRANENVTVTPFLVVEGDVVDPVCAAKKARADARRAGGLPSDPADELSGEDKGRNRLACLAIIRWLREAVELRLVAIVDAANKSCHGWFEMPPAPVVAELRTILPGLGCDPAMFKPSQPARLAGVKRGDRWQRLLFCELRNWRGS